MHVSPGGEDVMCTFPSGIHVDLVCTLFLWKTGLSVPFPVILYAPFSGEGVKCTFRSGILVDFICMLLAAEKRLSVPFVVECTEILYARFSRRKRG